MLLMMTLRLRELKSHTSYHFSESSENSRLRPKFLLLLVWCFYGHTDFINSYLKCGILGLVLPGFEVQGEKWLQLVSQDEGQRACPGQFCFENVTTEPGLLGAGSGIGQSGVKECLFQLYDFQLHMSIIPSQWKMVRQADFFALTNLLSTCKGRLRWSFFSQVIKCLKSTLRVFAWLPLYY